MRNRVASKRNRILTQAAIIALVAGLGAGCSSQMSRTTGSPLFTGSTENQRAIIDGASQPMPPAFDAAGATAPTTAVHSAALPPASGGQPMAMAQNSQWVSVGPGDTLYSIARRNNVSVDALAAANSISDPSHLPVGRQLVLPAGATGYAPTYQPVAAAAPTLGAPPSNLGTISQQDVAAIRASTPRPVASTPAAPSAPAGQHVVAAGDTVYSIARRYDARPDAIVSANGLQSANQIRIGQRLTIPGAGGSQIAAAPQQPARPAPTQTASLADPNVINDASPAPAQPAVATVPAAPPLPAVPSMPVQSAALNGNSDGPSAYTPPRTDSQNAALQGGAEPPSADGTSFRWPVRGRIISSFGTKPNGEQNDGINLAVPEGTSVKAAEAGTVIYSGNEIAGYGNLILVRHANGWVSAYAHNKTNHVARGDTVARGQNIAEAGQTGTVTSPQLHFELRKGSSPVNPLDHLAGA